MHVDAQPIIALAVVAAAAAVVVRRLWSQVVAFRAPKRRVGRSATIPRPAVPTSSPLIQIQRTPPIHLKRPPTDGS